jgi:hypothetical protein
MVTYYRYEVVRQGEEYQSFSLLGYETPLSDAVTLWVGRTSTALFGWIGTKGICLKSGGIPAFNIEDLSVTNIIVDGVVSTEPSETIGNLYSFLT